MIKVRADAEAEAIMNMATAKASAISVQLKAEKTSYKSMLSVVEAKIGTFTKAHLLEWIRSESITSTNASQVVIAVDQKV